MNGKTRTFSPGKPLNPLPGFLRISGNKGWFYVILGTAGILAAALGVYAILTWSTTHSKIQYAAADVVYGEKIHAEQDMRGSSNSQTSTFFSSNSSAEKPEMLLSDIFFDFGEVNAGEVLTRTFVIANSGKSPLIIERAYTTCGCTSADFTATEIPPGKVVLMTLQFDAGYHDLRGTTVRRGIMIETNDPDHPVQEIWIQASVR